MLELKEITKVFPGVKALDNVSVTFKPGEIHALMGENGAGKSTLMKIITGIYQADRGQILLNGKRLQPKSFQDAVDNSINMVSQEIQVIPEATVAENIILDHIGHFKSKMKIDWKTINEEAQKYLDVVGLDIKPTEKIGGLTAAQKQLIQIAKALSSRAQYILMDEPTSSLTKFETDNLIKIVKKLKEDNVCVIFVSHKLEEVMELCDYVSVLRDGKYVGTKSCEGLTKQDVIKMMIGREEESEHLGFLDIQAKKVLEVKNLTKYGQFNKVNLSLNKGEILGLYGLVGSGRTELAKLIIGAETMDEGEVYINGEKAHIKSIEMSLNQYKLGYVTENRKEEGLMLEDTVSKNISITVWNKILNKVRKINLKKESEIVEYMIQKMKIKTPTARTAVGTLSGGNQQKVSIGKWLAAGCDILIIDEPTVGVDVGAKAYIHQLIWELAQKEGKSIILISSDMPELISLSRRVLVFKEFQIVGEIKGLNDREYTYEEVSELIGECM